jgi:hypothetical protein
MATSQLALSPFLGVVSDILCRYADAPESPGAAF